MQSSNFAKAGLMALFLSVIALASWEFFLRKTDLPISYDDNEALWADKRAMVYEPINQATVFIGSSRIRYDLDIPTWQDMTGDHAIQLGNDGSNPRLVLDDLAKDENFKGKLIIDVTEGLFFGDFAPLDGHTIKEIEYFHHRTPTQRFSFEVNHLLESKFLFLDQDNYSFNAMMDHVPIPQRPNVFQMPLFPVEFDGDHFTRQAYMTPRFVQDSNLQNQVKAIWAFFGSLPHPPPPSGDKLQAIFNSVKSNVDKIRARGGKVIFVRTPSSGAAWMGESHGFPRAVYWDKLLSFTGCKGIYFLDYPAISNFQCPEWSHLSPDQAVIYTNNLVKILQEHAEWPMGNKLSKL